MVGDLIKRLIGPVLDAGGRIAQGHPYSWRLAWGAIHWFPFLLPHDKSYNAIRHFLAVSPKGLFLDVGANDGISVLSFRRFDKNYQILSLEPNGLLEPALQKIKSKDLRFDYRMIGAGSEPARVRFFVPTYKGVVLHTFTSSDQSQVKRAIEECFGSSVARHVKIHPISGEIVRLDDLELDPSIVKIDAEGSDYDVLAGLVITMSRARPFIMLEMEWTNLSRVQQLLHSRDYTLVLYDTAADRFDAKALSLTSDAVKQRNVFAIPREKLGDLPVLKAGVR